MVILQVCALVQNPSNVCGIHHSSDYASESTALSLSPVNQRCQSDNATLSIHYINPSHQSSPLILPVNLPVNPPRQSARQSSPSIPVLCPPGDLLLPMLNPPRQSAPSILLVNPPRQSSPFCALQVTCLTCSCRCSESTRSTCVTTTTASRCCPSASSAQSSTS